MGELGKTQRLLAERDRLDKELQIEQAREDVMQSDLVDGEGLTEEVASRIVGADKFMRAVTVHMVRTRDAITRLDGTLKDLSDNGFRMCEGHKVRLQTLETSDRDQWDAIGKKMDKGGRAPRTKAAAWSVGGAGIGGGVIYAIMDWLAKHYGAGGTP